MTDEVPAALDAATALVGPGRVTTETGNNTGLFRRRNVFGVVRPRNAKDVQLRQYRVRRTARLQHRAQLGPRVS